MAANGYGGFDFAFVAPWPLTFNQARAADDEHKPGLGVDASTLGFGALWFRFWGPVVVEACAVRRPWPRSRHARDTRRFG